MQPKRARLVLGIAAGVVGLFSGLTNLLAVVFLVLGPGVIKELVGEQMGVMPHSGQAYIIAMGSGVFRWMTLLMAVVGLAAASALLLGGLALIAERRVCRWLLAGWGWYGVLAGPVNVWLGIGYVLPEVYRLKGLDPDRLAIGLEAGKSLLLLWLLPVALLFVLRLPLLWRGWADERGQAVVPAPAPAGVADRPVPPGDSGVPRQAHVDLSDFNQRYPGLRDDPWNDPAVT